MALLFSIAHLTQNVKHYEKPPHWKGALMPSKDGKFQIIGNTDYNDIYDKFFLHLPTDKAEKVARRLTEWEIPFSGKVIGDKTTITIEYENLEHYKQAVSDVEFAELSPKEQILATMRKLYLERQKAEDEYYRTEFLSDYALAEYKSWGDETPEDEEMARAKEAVMQKWRERTIEFFNAADRLDSIEDTIVLLYEDYLMLEQKQIADLSAQRGERGTPMTTSEQIGITAESKQALYTIEQGDDIRHYKAAGEYSINDLLNAANSITPFLKLMDMGEQISIGEYAEIQQSDRFTFSIEMNFDTLSGTIYEVNGGKGGIAEEDRTDDNIRFTSDKLSKLDFEFEFAHEPSREEVISKNHHEAEHGADGYGAFSAPESAQDKTFAYEFGHSNPFTVVHLDISTEARRYAVSEALNNSINAYYSDSRLSNDMAQPYKNLLEQIKPKTEFIHAFEGHLSCLKHALRNANEDKELCMSMLDSVKHAEDTSRCGRIEINGENCRQTDVWEEHGVTYVVGQSIYDNDFYYARATDGKITRDYEYDREPDREKVMSDHADKLSEEYMDHYEAERGADGYGAFSAPNSQERAENIRQMQDISHNFNNAVPSAKRGERKDTMNTKFEVTSITKFDDDTARKALASVAVNNELIVSGISVREKENGELYVQMPRQKNGVDEQGKAKYEDRVFPVTAEAREAISNAVLGAYESLKEQGLENSFVKVEPPEKSTSKLKVSLSKTDNEKSDVKAKGQITINDCLVIKGVSVSERTNSKTKEKFFSVDLPHFKKNDKGDYPLVVKPITAEFREKINKTVMKSFNTQTRGVSFSDLGGKENVATYFRQDNNKAQQIMNELDSKGIPYHAKIVPDTKEAAGNTAISFRTADKAAVDSIKKGIENKEHKPSVIGEVGKIKAEQKAQEAEKPVPQKAKSNDQER